MNDNNKSPLLKVILPYCLFAFFPFNTIKKAALLLILMGLCAGNAYAYEPEDCSKYKQNHPEIRDVNHGVHADEPITFYFRDRVYRMPIGYAGIWFLDSIADYMAEHKDKINTSNDIDLRFWMPSLRRMELPHMSLNAWAPCEPGREQPAPNEYRVRVSVLSSISTPVSERIKNFRKNRSGAFESPIETNFGLLKYIDKFGAGDDSYTHKPGAAIELVIDCSAKVLYPGCDGYVYDSVNDNNFYVLFPRDRISDFHTIIASANQLLASWRVNAPRAVTPITANTDK